MSIQSVQVTLLFATVRPSDEMVATVVTGIREALQVEDIVTPRVLISASASVVGVHLSVSVTKITMGSDEMARCVAAHIPSWLSAEGCPIRKQIDCSQCVVAAA